MDMMILSVPNCLSLGKPNDVVKIEEKDHSLSITPDNLVEKKGQAGDEEADELSSGDEDCSKGMRSKNLYIPEKLLFTCCFYIRDWKLDFPGLS